ncbi:MAG: response regulator transcription factor [Anaerolineae bacterium]|nr:response regulator transcription factor [Anaerolineae bacterium]
MKKILVVDDEPAALTMMELILQRHGYQPLPARDGSEAVKLLQTHRIDLILADVAMPGLNGYQLCQLVKNSSEPDLALIPFIFISARSLASDIRYGKSLGADDYLTKPFDVEDLLAVIKGKLRAAELLHQTFTQPLLDQPPAVINLTIGDRQLWLDHDRRQAWLDGQELLLTRKEMRVLEYLARRPGWVVSDVELVKATHRLERVSKQQARRKSVRAIISYLRRKLAVHLAGVACIKTVRGRGYMLCLSDEAGKDNQPQSYERQIIQTA